MIVKSAFLFVLVILNASLFAHGLPTYAKNSHHIAANLDYFLNQIYENGGEALYTKVLKEMGDAVYHALAKFVVSLDSSDLKIFESAFDETLRNRGKGVRGLLDLNRSISSSSSLTGSFSSESSDSSDTASGSDSEGSGVSTLTSSSSSESSDSSDAVSISESEGSGVSTLTSSSSSESSDSSDIVSVSESGGGDSVEVVQAAAIGGQAVSGKPSTAWTQSRNRRRTLSAAANVQRKKMKLSPEGSKGGKVRSLQKSNSQPVLKLCEQMQSRPSLLSWLNICDVKSIKSGVHMPLSLNANDLRLHKATGTVQAQRGVLTAELLKRLFAVHLYCFGLSGKKGKGKVGGYSMSPSTLKRLVHNLAKRREFDSEGVWKLLEELPQVLAMKLLGQTVVVKIEDATQEEGIIDGILHALPLMHARLSEVLRAKRSVTSHMESFFKRVMRIAHVNPRITKEALTDYMAVRQGQLEWASFKREMQRQGLSSDGGDSKSAKSLAAIISAGGAKKPNSALRYKAWCLISGAFERLDYNSPDVSVDLVDELAGEKRFDTVGSRVLTAVSSLRNRENYTLPKGVLPCLKSKGEQWAKGMWYGLQCLPQSKQWRGAVLSIQFANIVLRLQVLELTEAQVVQELCLLSEVLFQYDMLFREELQLLPHEMALKKFMHYV